MTKEKTNCLTIITARGGSKGIPRKNIKPLLGKPLIAWTIEQAKKSKYIDRIIVSTVLEELYYKINNLVYGRVRNNV